VSKDVGSVVIVRSQKGSAYQKFRKPCFKATVFFHTTVNTKFVFTGIVKFIVIQKCAVRKLAVTPTCRNSTWSTEWFVLIADPNETQFGGGGGEGNSKKKIFGGGFFPQNRLFKKKKWVFKTLYFKK